MYNVTLFQYITHFKPQDETYKAIGQCALVLQYAASCKTIYSSPSFEKPPLGQVRK